MRVSGLSHAGPDSLGGGRGLQGARLLGWSFLEALRMAWWPATATGRLPLPLWAASLGWDRGNGHLLSMVKTVKLGGLGPSVCHC